MARRSTIARELENLYDRQYERTFLHGGREPEKTFFSLDYDHLENAKLWIRRTAYMDAMRERNKLGKKILEEDIPSPEIDEDAVDPGLISG